MKNSFIIGAVAVAGIWSAISLTNDGKSNSHQTKIRDSSYSVERSYESGDRDCTDFSSQRAAQSFFELQGGPQNDPHGLDRDGDGIACENN